MSTPIKELKLTPTEERILGILSDGLPHKIEELMTCLWDDLGAEGNLRKAICILRKKMLPFNHSIVSQSVNNVACYRRVVFYSAVLDQSCLSDIE